MRFDFAAFFMGMAISTSVDRLIPVLIRIAEALEALPK